MNIAALLHPERIACRHEADNKKCALAYLADLISKPLAEADGEQIFADFINRERLGSTAIGHGVAIPHIRSNATQRPLGVFIQLTKGIEFGAADEQTVDLIFGLMVPTLADETHLQLLADLADCFSQDDLRNTLRQVNNSIDLYQILLDYDELTSPTAS